MAGQWEQFARNFETFYKLGNKVQTGLATKKILDEEVETIQAPDAAGPGVPHSGYNSQGGIGSRFRYDGKIYDKQITGDQLKGLQDKRIAAEMTRFGDAEGATKMLTSKAQLKNLNLDNQVKEGTLAETIKRVKIDNDAKLKTMDLTDAQITRYNQLTPLMGEKYLADIESQKVSTAQSVSKFASEKSILDDKATMSSYELAEYEADEDNRDKSRGVTAKKLTNEEKEADLKSKQIDLDAEVFTSSYEEVLATRLLESGEAKDAAEASKLAAERNLAGNQALSDFATAMKKGGELFGADALTQQEWLTTRWQESGGDKAVKQLIDTIKADDLASLTAEGSRLMTEVGVAFSGKSQNLQKEALVKLIDGQDGIEGNMKFGKDAKGNTVLYEYPSVEAMNADKKDLGAGGEPVAKGKKNGWDSFREGFYNEFTPLKSLEIAKLNSEIAYKDAQTAELTGKAAATRQAKEDDIWAAERRTPAYEARLTQAIAAWEKNNEVPNTSPPIVEIEKALKAQYFASTNDEFDGFSSPDFP